MGRLNVRAGDFSFQARFEEQLAPRTYAAFRKAKSFTLTSNLKPLLAFGKTMLWQRVQKVRFVEAA